MNLQSMSYGAVDPNVNRVIEETIAMVEDVDRRLLSLKAGIAQAFPTLAPALQARELATREQVAHLLAPRTPFAFGHSPVTPYGGSPWPNGISPFFSGLTPFASTPYGLPSAFGSIPGSYGSVPNFGSSIFPQTGHFGSPAQAPFPGVSPFPGIGSFRPF